MKIKKIFTYFTSNIEYERLKNTCIANFIPKDHNIIKKDVVDHKFKTSL